MCINDSNAVTLSATIVNEVLSMWIESVVLAVCNVCDVNIFPSLTDSLTANQCVIIVLSARSS